MINPIVFIQSYERPIYLWACLDSLYRNTKHPCRFVLIDNASRDPLVNKVIGAFEARGMFYSVHRRKENTQDAMPEALKHHNDQLGEYFGYVQSDILVHPSEPCWLTEFISLVQENPDLGLVGSLVDKSDFVDPIKAVELFPNTETVQLNFLIKARSPERTLRNNYDERLIDPFNPPGRLQFLKREFIDKAGWILRDRPLYETCKRLGYKAAIATRVRHRHLSLLNLFDYPESEVSARNRFFGVPE